MDSNDLLVKEYLESLKEDTELDYLFPILLRLMKFSIVTTARESKGQSQYGKDIIAIGKDENGIKKRFYFELKGFSDKDITQTSLLKQDGILESIREAKLVAFNDTSIPGFNDLPVQIVVVHNGVIKSDARLTLEGILTKEFPEGGFERWDIYRLTELFSQYLFGEYLFTEEESIRLFKRTLVLLDAPDYDFSDFKQLVEKQTEKIYDVQSRAFKKYFASMNLLSVLIIHYSRENGNLYPARECVTFLVLRVWAWILRSDLHNKKGVLKEFRKLLRIHYDLLDEYFQKMSIAVEEQDGLFSEAGKQFEPIGYPLRCFEHLGYLNYFLYARMWFPTFEQGPSQKKQQLLVNRQLEYLVKLINFNDGCSRPLIDRHSVPIVATVLFFIRNKEFISDIKEHLSNLLEGILNNIVIIKNTRDRFPELYNNIEQLVEFVATGERPKGYIDSSSLLITYIFDILALIGNEEIYNFYRNEFDDKIDLQLAQCALSTDELEPLLFTKNLYNEMHVESGIRLPEIFADYKSNLKGMDLIQREYKTDLVGFPFLRLLAHIYFANDFLPEEWRNSVV